MAHHWGFRTFRAHSTRVTPATNYVYYHNISLLHFCRCAWLERRISSARWTRKVRAVRVAFCARRQSLQPDLQRNVGMEAGWFYTLSLGVTARSWNNKKRRGSVLEKLQNGKLEIHSFFFCDKKKFMLLKFWLNFRELYGAFIKTSHWKSFCNWNIETFSFGVCYAYEEAKIKSD